MMNSWASGIAKEKESKINLLDLSIDEIESLVAGLGEPKFRGKQIYQWINKGVESFDEMSNLSKSLRRKLSEISQTGLLKVENKLVSKIDNTIKYLLSLPDGNVIECVVMEYKHGNTICVSSQVGCKMGCKFCASTVAGFVRNLTPGEILGQIVTASWDSGRKISNVVIMGIGEPLDNYDNIVKFIKLANCKEGLNIGNRRFSLSTCGVVPKILKLAKEKIPLTLSISLHATNDEDRSLIMPINRKYSIDKLIEACKIYTKETGRRITFEYAMIHGVNDSVNDAEKLAELIGEMSCHVNLIPVNPVSGTGFKKSSKHNIDTFLSVLESHGISTTIRRELGSDINAACGQLRRNVIDSSVNISSGGHMPEVNYVMDFALMSDIGKLRQLNEDYCGYYLDEDKGLALFVLADGMGGHNAGEVASKVAVDNLIKYVSDKFNIEQEAENSDYLAELIRDAINYINTNIYNMATDNDALYGMGTTLVILAIRNNKAIFANIGDSRGYLIDEKTIKQLTTDHSYTEELVRKGTITKEEARNHPKKNEITRAVGVSKEVEPDFISIDIYNNDIFLLCSDGLTNELEEEEIRDIILSSETAHIASKRLLTNVNEKGGHDNISVIVVRMSDSRN